MKGDHIDRNLLNNCRNNLRPCTQSQNGINSNLKSNNTSGYRGIWFDKRRNKWYARIRVNGETRGLGSFDTKEKAALCYNYYAKLIHSEFAVLNEIK